MTIYTTCDSMTLSDSTSFTVRCSFSFLASGIGVNDTYNVTMTPPSPSSALTMNAAIRTAVSNYVDASYGTTTTGQDVLLITGAIALPLL